MAREQVTRSKDGMVPLARIRERIPEISKFPLSFTKPPLVTGGRNFACFLEFNGKDERHVFKVGPLSRWLIAIELLTRDRANEDKVHELLGLGDGWGMGQNVIKRMFGLRKDDRQLLQPSRFEIHDREASDPTDRRVAKVTNAIIELLNEKFSARRHKPITIAEFLAVPIPVPERAEILSEAPIEWFRNWLMWGAGIAASTTDLEQLRKDAGRGDGKLLAEWDSLLPRLVDEQVSAFAVDGCGLGTDGGSHQHIVNVHSEFAAGALDSFAAAAHLSLRERSRLDLESFRAPKIQLVQVSLKRGATCVRVLQDLYEAFGLDPGPLQAVRRGERGIDLTADLAPLRKVLTVNKVVVIFSGWDCAAGPFAALHDYLCNTDWAEFLRILAQPDLSTVRAAPGEFRPCYQLLVLSRGQSAALGPWAHCVALSEVWSQRGVAVRDLDERLLEQLQALPMARRPGAAQIALLKALKEPARGELIETLGNTVEPRDRRQGDLRLLRSFIAQCELQQLDVPILCMIAASINGMQRRTLRRCMDEWDMLFRSDRTAARATDESSAAAGKSSITDEQFQRALARIEQKWRGLIVEVDDAELEALSTRRRDLELSRAPFVGEPHSEAAGPKVLIFASHELRGWFVSAWSGVAGDPAGTSGARGAAETAAADKLFAQYPSCSWDHVNFVLAEEAIRQATLQLRHATVDSPSSTRSLCCAVQGLIHGLASLEVPAEDFPALAGIAGGLYGLALPVHAGKRYRYLYGFLYRRVIEGGDWRLGRSFARSDLRLDILNLLLTPVAVPSLLGAPDSTAASEVLPEHPFPAPPAGRAAASLARELTENRELWSDLVEAIAHAGRDLEGTRGERALMWALQRLPHPGAPAEVNAALPNVHSRSGSNEISAVKLRVDWLLRRNSQQLDEAEEICNAQLARLGISARYITEELFTATDAALQRARRCDAEALTAMLNRFSRVQGHIERCVAPQPLREEAAQFLFRLGEILATRADDLSEVPLSQVTNAFLRSFAVYWVADRVRSSAGAGAQHLGGVGWPKAAARSMRYFVRVIMKLARLLSKEHTPSSGEPLSRISSQLLEQAQNRIGVYSRHNYRFKRQRDSILTLEAARLRAWVRVQLEHHEPAGREAQRRLTDLQAAPEMLEAERSGEAASALRDHHRKKLLDLMRVLEASWELLDEAETIVISLGFEHVQRLLLERTKTAIAFMHLATAAHAVRVPDEGELRPGFNKMITTYSQLARSSLDALTAASADMPYWQRIVKRQESRMIEARRALAAIQQPLSRVQ